MKIKLPSGLEVLEEDIVAVEPMDVDFKLTTSDGPFRATKADYDFLVQKIQEATDVQ